MKVLITAFFNLGDVILLTAALDWLKKHKPSLKITVLVRENVRCVVENNPVFENVIIADYKPKKISFLEMYRLVREIRKQEFDVVLLLGSKLRSTLIAFFAGIKRRIAVDGLFCALKKEVQFFCTQTLLIEHDVNSMHQVESLKSIFKKAFAISDEFDKKKNRPVLPVLEKIKKEDLKKMLQKKLLNDKINIDKKYWIALCVKGTFALKNWPKEYFQKLIECMAQKYQAMFFILGAKSDFEYAENLIQGVKNVSVKNFCGCTNFQEALAVLRCSDILVSVCTGMVHMASAMNTPTVGIYGCTSALRWGSLSDKSASCSANLDCSPCQVKEDECLYAKKCLYDVSVNNVLQKVENLLK